VTAKPDGRGDTGSIVPNSSENGVRSSIEAEIVEKLPDLPPAKRKEVVMIAAQIVEHHSGPLPPPRMLAEYEKILPGLADRIVGMAEGDLAHNHQMQSKGLGAEIRERLVGQVGTIAIALMALVVSGWMVSSGHPLPGFILGGATLAGIATVLIGGKEYLLSKLEKSRPVDKPKPVSSGSKKRR
jgi:uncharacterized membrane protein